MADTVRLRPNHYELLGLSPGASTDEISKAFAKQLGQLTVRPFGWLAQVSVAYETLRDPAKRKAYDSATFPKPAGHPVMAQFFRRPVAATPKPAPAPKPQDEWKPAPPAPVMFREPRPEASETAATPQVDREEAVRRAILAKRERDLPPPVQPAPAPAPAPRHDVPEIAAAESGAPMNWKLPAIAAGGLFLAIAGGAWAGIEAGNDNEQAEAPQRIATLRVPQARPAPAVEEDPLFAAPALAEARPEPKRRSPVAAARVELNREPLEIELPEQQAAEAPQSGQIQPETPIVEAAVAEAPAVVATAGRMPLPNATIARTIGRIGYPCGSVASTSEMEGGGVFKVTCTSGHSYRAAPVRGRYRFKRMG